MNTQNKTAGETAEHQLDITDKMQKSVKKYGQVTQFVGFNDSSYCITDYSGEQNKQTIEIAKYSWSGELLCTINFPVADTKLLCEILSKGFINE